MDVLIPLTVALLVLALVIALARRGKSADNGQSGTGGGRSAAEPRNTHTDER